MAKCPICNARKGKRKCLIADNMICSLCCGNTRKAEACSGCRFYQKPKRKYNEVPTYTVTEMDEDPDLTSHGSTIEGALCAYDIENENRLYDGDAIRILELLIDKYHFLDQKIEVDNHFIADGFHYVENAIREDLEDVNDEIIVKVLAVILFVAKRRTKGGREYMRIIHQFAGQRVVSGGSSYGAIRRTPDSVSFQPTEKQVRPLKNYSRTAR